MIIYKYASLKISSIIIAVILLFGSCKANQQKTSLCQPIIKDTELYNKISDPFDIKKVWIEQNCLKVNISYSGGCGDATFKLVWNGSMMKSLPPQIPMKIIMEDKDDCRSIIQKTLCFSLNEIYENSYIILLDGYNGSILVNKDNNP
ncbi:MAG: hypothetical protein LC101_09535 [Flavobacteriales bacterium]|nr:hypothetical protein [Flavobacteriales bacterium]MCZ2339087.1 hypothetical protein [Chitinophagales bacterium]MCZ2444000.1 hypothetical protein [Flavobacteriales bacterium]